MKIPRSFYIKGKKWKVVLVKNLRDDSGEVMNGLTNPEKRIIELHAELKDDKLSFIFWHEFTHALLHEAHVTGNDGGLETIIEEIICDAVADALVPYVKFNSPRKGKK